MTSGLLEAKLMLPPPRSGSVLRSRLVELVRSGDRPVVSVAAPAGYGKSTFLRQWADSEDRAVAWVSLEPTDDDETVVLRTIAAALDRVEPHASTALDGSGHATGTLPMEAATRLADAIWRMRRPVVLMLDDVHHVTTPAATDLLAWLAEHLPPGACLAVSSRERPPLPLARLRARGQLLEVGPSDLALTTSEAAELIERMSVDIDAHHVAELTRRTEGWPAGIYMAALAHAAGGTGTTADLRASGRYVTDFLRHELLDRSPPELITFLCRSAPLVRFDAATCDHVLDRQDSAAVLAELERTNLFLIPLGDRAGSYRYHHLFRESLLAELRRRQPEQESVVLQRAATWSAEHEDPEAAIEYAHLAGDDAMVARLLETHALRLYRSGRMGTLDRWFGWFDSQRLTRAPRLAMLGAWVWALSGRTSRAERWSDAVLPVLSDLDPVERGWYAGLRSVMGRLSPDELLEESRVARSLIPEATPWRATAFLGGGALHLMLGDLSTAEVMLIHATDVGLDDGGIPAATTALALRARIAIVRGSWELAGELTRRTRSLITEHGLETYATSVLSYVMSARVAIHRGATEMARADLATAQRLRAMLTAALPYLAAVVRIELANAYLALAEHAGARLMLAEVEEIVAIRPGIAPVAAEVATLRARSGTPSRGATGAATLTTAELRLLGYLPSHLTFREIAERLIVSINTVKTQAISIYGKLGVSSRSAAIEAAVECGLLDPTVMRFPSRRPDIEAPPADGPDRRM